MGWRVLPNCYKYTSFLLVYYQPRDLSFLFLKFSGRWKTLSWGVRQAERRQCGPSGLGRATRAMGPVILAGQLESGVQSRNLINHQSFPSREAATGRALARSCWGNYRHSSVFARWWPVFLGSCKRLYDMSQHLLLLQKVYQNEHFKSF